MSDVEIEIDWLDGTGYHELSERERALMDKAREAGYAAGERHGYRIGGADALRAATELSTLLSDRRMRLALETLRYFLDAVDRELSEEVEQASAYWKAEVEA
jgi:hypothetical protein